MRTHTASSYSIWIMWSKFIRKFQPHLMAQIIIVRRLISSASPWCGVVCWVSSFDWKWEQSFSFDIQSSEEVFKRNIMSTWQRDDSDREYIQNKHEMWMTNKSIRVRRLFPTAVARLPNKTSETMTKVDAKNIESSRLLHPKMSISLYLQVRKLARSPMTCCWIIIVYVNFKHSK